MDNLWKSFLIIFFIFQLITLTIQNKKTKYSKELNSKLEYSTSSKPIDSQFNGNTNIKDVIRPFRMNKLNVIWDKAVHRLSENKLKSLYGDLKFQDKEELQLKRLKSEGGDKEGLMEADIRRKLKGILNNYSLSHLFEEGKDYMSQDKQYSKQDQVNQNQLHKKLFKDKKLNRLWEKAEKSGFTDKELKTLKEEFMHHQDKLDEYYNIMESLTAEEKNLMHNDIPDVNSLLEDSIDDPDISHRKMESKYANIVNTRQNLKENYDKLHRKTVSGPGATEFYEPRVQQLWKLALEANFTRDELASLHTELKHYEKRIDKLNHIQAEYLLKSHFKEKSPGDPAYHHSDKDTNSLFEDKIKRHERDVEKLHFEIEDKLKRRHMEL